MRVLLFTLAFLWIMPAAQAQQTEQEKLRELDMQKEQQRTRQVNARLDSAIQLFEQEQFEAADTKFKTILAALKSIPSDVAYHFGRNSYGLGKYKQSVDWLTKYIQLKGTTGQFSQDAVTWLKKAEEALVLVRKAESTNASQVLSKDYIIDCGPSGKVACPVCNGSTVVIKKDYMGEKYSTCIYCNKLGILTCEEYNKLLRGELKGTPDVK